MKTPILGSSYTTRSVHAAANRMVNLFPELILEGGKDAAYLMRTPGLRLLVTAGTGPIRGLWAFGDYGYVVSGTTLYQIDNAWAATSRGTVLGTDPVSMADNGTQLMVAAGTHAYIYNAATVAFSEITDPDFPGATTVGYLDGYFVFNEPDSQSIWVTSLFDGTAIDPLDFASAEGFPDNLLAVVIDHREAWLFGTHSTEVWYNSGGADFPLERTQGAVLEVGTASSYCIAKLDNTLFWLANDGIVYRANGYTQQRVSTHAVEQWISDNVDLSGARAYSYKQDGHAFLSLSFPDGDVTWFYDVATDRWHERAAWVNGAYERHQGVCHMVFNGEQVVGDRANGKVYAFDSAVYSDAGEVQRWLRSWRVLPPGINRLKGEVHHSLQLDCEAGVGLLTGQGSTPEVMLRWSDDGGKTWSNELWRSMGAIGVTGTHVIWRRLGSSQKLRDRVYEVSGSDPVRIIITGAEVDVEPLDD